MLVGEGGKESPPIGKDSRGSAQVAADEALAEAVAGALNGSSMLANVSVSARSGMVTLSGTVSSFEARDQALELTRAVAGVANVNEQIRVRTTD
jgi:osmotically-inducible protein OsmY